MKKTVTKILKNYRIFHIVVICIVNNPSNIYIIKIKQHISFIKRMKKKHHL